MKERFYFEIAIFLSVRKKIIHRVKTTAYHYW